MPREETNKTKKRVQYLAYGMLHSKTNCFVIHGHTNKTLYNKPQFSLAGFTTREGGSVLILLTGAGTISGCPSIMHRIFRSSFGQWYFMNKFRKHGTSLLDDPLSMMVINLPFLLLAWTARSAKIRSDSSRNMHCSSAEGSKTSRLPLM